MKANLRLVGTAGAEMMVPPTPSGVTLLLWGWPEVLKATGIPRRTLDRELAAGKFVKPALKIGRRPYWRPGDVERWASGQGGR